MESLLLWVGRLAGIAGGALTIGAGAARIGGVYQLGSFQAITLLQAGTAGMVLACLAYVAVLGERRASAA